ncbi:hypothetical protein TRVA0_002S03620 [Trichomonascus vanleenenianus]|uniref:uncharacterized protein n=1 Tax=Trichomonascus vanleenenianus TaxID=2268995 RepID=UPI003ECB5EFC
MWTPDRLKRKTPKRMFGASTSSRSRFLAPPPRTDLGGGGFLYSPSRGVSSAVNSPGISAVNSVSNSPNSSSVALPFAHSSPASFRDESSISSEDFLNQQQNYNWGISPQLEGQDVDFNIFDLSPDAAVVGNLSLDLPSPAHSDILSPVSDEVLFKVPQWTDMASVDEWSRVMRAYRPSSFTTEQDLQRFLQVTFLRTKCTFNYPLANDDKNPLWELIAEEIDRFDFLKFAVLTVSSNVLEIFCKCDDWMPYRKKYMDLCMQSLIMKIASYRENDEIIALLATVMILYSDRSATSSNKWRLHLKGGLELLKAASQSAIRNPLFATLRTWFAVAETYAWMSSPGGGTIDSNDTALLDDSAFAHTVDGLVVDGYNTFRGYSQQLVPFFSKAAAKIVQRKYCSMVYDDEEEEVLAALREIERLESQQFPYLAVDTNRNSESIKLCMWYSHRIHCCSLRLFYMVKLLGWKLSDSRVQSLTKRTLQLIQEMPMQQALGISVHWPTFMAGRCSITISDRAAAESALNQMIAIGLFVARNSLHRLHSYWDKYDDGELDIEADDMDSTAY